ncbi:hypothetical protein [Streptomyces sp. NPDC006368]|uniref:hypothetical protein n=1 Tax=Streptomyces sp. NPDC006368 TaxID=3156760 RepID=UPI0033B7CB4C
MPAPAAPPRHDHDTAPAGRLPAVVLMAGSCLPVLGAVLLAPVLPRMQDHFEGVPGSAALVPVVLTVPALALALLAPFAGMIVDRLGRKRLPSSPRVSTQCPGWHPSGWTPSTPY